MVRRCGGRFLHGWGMPPLPANLWSLRLILKPFIYGPEMWFFPKFYIKPQFQKVITLYQRFLVTITIWHIWVYGFHAHTSLGKPLQPPAGRVEGWVFCTGSGRTAQECLPVCTHTCTIYIILPVRPSTTLFCVCICTNGVKYSTLHQWTQGTTENNAWCRYTN